MSFVAPTPNHLLRAKVALSTAALATATALTVTTVAPSVSTLARPSDVAVSAPLQTLTAQQVQLLASMGIYTVGPGAQIARSLGFGTPQDALNNLASLAALIPGDAGAQLQTTIESIASALAAAQVGVTFPLLGNVSLPEIAVPPAGPAGTIDQVATLEYAASTALLLSLVKTGMMNGDAVGVLLDIIGGATGLDTEALSTLVADLPLNVPGTAGTVEVPNPLYPLFSDDPYIEAGAFASSADKLAIIPTFGLGGTNFALASPTFLNDPTFANTAILAIALRNASRPGGGLIALLNPLSQTVGLNLSNVDGQGTPRTIVVGNPPVIDVNALVTEYDGNVTVWDITAAYDLLSDAPSTIFNPLAWMNSGVGSVSPTYLIPANISDFAAVLEDVTSGQFDIATLNTLLGTLNSTISMFNVDVAEDGNLYVTYNSGNLPLLEPLQFVPRTLSYVPGFNVSTPVSSSFEDVLTQLVAQGYQDVNMTLDAEGVATFVRGFDEAGTQAKVWQNPVSWEMGMETPQTVFNSIITGLQQNLFNPEGVNADGSFVNQLELFGNSDIGNAIYRNAVAVALAKVISDGLEQIRDTLNPVMNQAQDALRPLAQALDSATAEANRVVDDGLEQVAGLGVDLYGPMLDANRSVNDITGQVTSGIRDAIGLDAADAPSGAVARSTVFTSAGTDPGNPFVGAPADTLTLGSEAEVISGGTDLIGGVDLAPGAGVEDDTNTGVVINETIAIPNPSPVGGDEEVTETVGVVDSSSGDDADATAGDSSDAPKLTPRERLRERAEARAAKTENSLNKRRAEAEDIGNSLRSGDLKGAADKTGDALRARVDRLGKDINNGVRKVESAIDRATSATRGSSGSTSSVTRGGDSGSDSSGGSTSSAKRDSGAGSGSSSSGE